MSRDAAIAFLKKAIEDAELQEKIVAFAKEQGYTFTVDELSEAELGEVTGGARSYYIKYEGLNLNTTVKLDTTLTSDLSTDLKITGP